MSAATTAAIVGTGVSIYNGAKAGKAADAANAQALDAFGANQDVASALKARQSRLVDVPLSEKLAELQGTGLTHTGQAATDRFKYDMSQADRAIQEASPIVGEGVTGSRELTNQFRKATGVAEIGMRDQAQKDAELGGYLQLAAQSPAWAPVAMNANTQRGSYFSGQAADASANEASSYAAAAKGMASLADLYASGTY
jgi:hypothetical protein